MPKTEYRNSTLARKIMARVSVRKNKGKFNLEDTKYILELFGNASIIDGATEDLTVVAIDRKRPMSRTNAMVTTVRQAQHRMPAGITDKARNVVSVD